MSTEHLLKTAQLATCCHFIISSAVPDSTHPSCLHTSTVAKTADRLTHVGVFRIDSVTQWQGSVDLAPLPHMGSPYTSKDHADCSVDSTADDEGA